ncbi:MAG: c-type cytochrome [Geminicoccaceae bacterium]
MRRKLELLAALSVFAAAGPLTAQNAGGAKSDTAAQARSLMHGAYTEAQASRGEDVFQQRCALCHSTAEFSSPNFFGGWSGQPVHALYTMIRDRMPLDNPGSLTPQQYTDILAYFFGLRDLPTGDDELPADAEAQKAIRIEISSDSVKR